MAIAVKCPECSYKGQVPDAFEGRKVKCPECTKFFTVTASVVKDQGKSAPVNGTAEKTVPEKAEASRSTAEKGADKSAGDKAASRTAPGKDKAGSRPGSRKSGGNAFAFDDAGSSDAKSPAIARYKKKKKDATPRGPLALGLVAVVLALVGAGVCFVPRAVMAALGLGIGGAVFGLLGLAWGLVGKRLSMASLAGLLLAGGAAGLAFAVKAGAIKLPGSEPPVEVAARPVEEKKPDPKPAPPPDQPGVTWRMAPDVVRTGSARIKVSGAQIGPVPGSDLDAKAKKPLLLVQLQVENTGEKPLEYRGGGSPDLSQNEDLTPRAMDSAGNNLKLVTFAKGSVTGQVKSQAIERNKPVSDVLVFDKPADNVDFLRVELPGPLFGGTELLRVQIPKDLIVQATATTPTTPMPMPTPTTPTPTPTPKPPPATGEVDEKTAQEIRVLLKDKDRNTRIEGCEKIGALKAKGVPLAPDLVALLDDKDDRVRVAAAENIGDLGPLAAAEVVLPLGKSLDDEFHEVQRQAAIALGKMGAEAKLALPVLQKLFKATKDNMIKQAIQEAIKKIDPKAKVG